MSQIIWDEIIAASTSGSQLATLLNDFKNAMVSGMSGNSRPTNIQASGSWVDETDSGAGYLHFKLYDGTQDITLFTVNTTTSSIIMGAAEDSIEIIKTSDDSLGPSILLEKKRSLGGGQTLENDIIGDIDFKGNDNTETDYVQARIRVISTDDVSGTEQGSYMVFSTTAQDGSALVEAVRIDGDGNLGIGENSPAKRLTTKATVAAVAGGRHELEADNASGVEEIIQKKRIASSGQTIASDIVSKKTFQAVDQNGAEVEVAQMEVKVSETTTDAAQGSTVTIRNKKIGEIAYSDAITITDTIAVDRNLGITGTLSSTSALTVDAGGADVTGNSQVTGNLIVTGDLTTQGTTTQVDTTNLNVKDKNILINDGGDDASSEGAGVTVERTGTDGSIIYADAATSKFKVGALGSEIEVADISSTQQISNKGIVTPSRADAKQDTLANLTTYASSATNGQFCFATDEKKMYQVVDSALAAVGGGGVGDSSIYQVLNFQDDKVSDWNTANLTNASIAEETSAPLNGDTSLKFTNHASAAGEYAYSESIAVPLRSRGKENGIKFQFTNAGTKEYVKAEFYDVTNTTVLGTMYLTAETVSKSAIIYGNVPASCTAAVIRLVVVTGEAASLLIDDVEFTDQIWATASLIETQDYVLDQSGNALTDLTNEIEFNLATANITNNGVGIIMAVDDSSNTRTKFIANRKCIVEVGISLAVTTTNHRPKIYKNGTSVLEGTYAFSNGAGSSVSGSIGLEAGEYFSVGTTGTVLSAVDKVRMVFTATAAAEHVLIASEQAVEKQVDLTVTGTNWTTTRAVGIYYTTHDGTHRIRFNIAGTLSAGTTSFTGTIGGVTFKTGYLQPIAVMILSSSYNNGYVNGGGSTFVLNTGSSATGYRVSGDVELDSKPTWGETLSNNIIVALPSTFMGSQYNLTVTGTNWTTVRAVGVPYEVSGPAGGWRLKFNIYGTVTSQTGNTIFITGVTFNTTINQTCAVRASSVAYHAKASIGVSSGTGIYLDSSSATINWILSGDVELDSKPTWL